MDIRTGLGQNRLQFVEMSNDIGLSGALHAVNSAPGAPPPRLAVLKLGRSVRACGIRPRSPPAVSPIWRVHKFFETIGMLSLCWFRARLTQVPRRQDL
jgi:hypothetical protein